MLFIMILAAILFGMKDLFSKRLTLITAICFTIVVSTAVFDLYIARAYFSILIAMMIARYFRLLFKKETIVSEPVSPKPVHQSKKLDLILLRLLSQTCSLLIFVFGLLVVHQILAVVLAA